MADDTIDGRTATALAWLSRRARDKAPTPKLPRSGHVYFCGTQDGPIKIGFSADPGERLYRLQTDCPDRLFLWAEVEGGEEQERAYHARFGDHRLQGEWFTRHPDILAEIERINATDVSCAHKARARVRSPYTESRA